jgi:Tat protein secretion system quality control protein TatD with DNase activity
MIERFASLGAYFSPSPSKLWHSQSLTSLLESVPDDRLLLETDAPDQLLPVALDRYQLSMKDATTRLNHPANIVEIYSKVSEVKRLLLPDLAKQIELNFLRLFGSLRR